MSFLQAFYACVSYGSFFCFCQTMKPDSLKVIREMGSNARMSFKQAAYAA